MFEVKIFDGPKDKIGKIIHSAYTNGAKLTSGVITNKIQGIDEFEFTIMLDNPAFNKIKSFVTLIKVKNIKEDKIVFDGRVYAPSPHMDSDGSYYQSYICESNLAYLLDSRQRYLEVHDTTVKGFLEIIINRHNETVKEKNPEKVFKIGDVTVKNSTDNVYRYIDYETTYETIKSKLIDRLGGFLVIRKETNGLYVDYLEDVGEISETPLQVGLNLKSSSKTVDMTNLITRLVPLGKTIEKEGSENESAASQPRIDIKSVNNGKDYLDDLDLQSEFGIIEGTEIWDDVSLPINVLSKGKEFLKNQKPVSEKWSIDAIDLRIAGYDVEDFKIGNRYLFDNEIMSPTEYLQIIEKKLNIISPQDTSISLGDKEKTLSQYQADIKKQNKNNENLGVIVQKQQNSINDLSNTVNDIDLGPIQTEINKKPNRTELEKYQPLITDTGWVSSGITFENGTVVYNTTSATKPAYRIVKIGNLEMITIRAEIKNVPTANWQVCLNFPANARPNENVAFSMPSSGNMQCRWSFEPTGNLIINGRVGETPNAGSWYPILVTFYRGGI